MNTLNVKTKIKWSGGLRKKISSFYKLELAFYHVGGKIEICYNKIVIDWAGLELESTVCYGHTNFGTSVP